MCIRDRDKGVIKNLLPDSLKSTIEFLPLLDVGEALVVGDAILLPSNYKWANLKNCTKLHCEFHKWIKIIAFLCALKKITILFQLNGITDFVISSFKRTEPTSTHCTHEMCQWHKQPVPFDSLCRAYLIAVQCQFLLTLAEKYFNRPSTHIPGKNLLCRQGCVCTDRCV